MGMMLDTDRGQFDCPLCKRLSNILIPALNRVCAPVPRPTAPVSAVGSVGCVGSAVGREKEGRAGDREIRGKRGSGERGDREKSGKKGMRDEKRGKREVERRDKGEKEIRGGAMIITDSSPLKSIITTHSHSDSNNKNDISEKSEINEIRKRKTDNISSYHGDVISSALKKTQRPEGSPPTMSRRYSGQETAGGGGGRNGTGGGSEGGGGGVSPSSSTSPVRLSSPISSISPSAITIGITISSPTGDAAVDQSTVVSMDCDPDDESVAVLSRESSLHIPPTPPPVPLSLPYWLSWIQRPILVEKVLRKPVGESLIILNIISSFDGILRRLR